MPRRLNRPAWSATAGELTLLVAIAAALIIDAALCPDARGNSPEGVAAVAVAVVPLWWRVRCPLAVVGLVSAGIALCLLTLKPVDTVVIPGMLALYAVARHGDRRRSLIVAAFIVPFVIVSVFAASHGEMLNSSMVTNTALVLLALAYGDTRRARCAAKEAEEESRRQQLLEAEHDAERRVTEERLRIAREVHDVVAHAMVAINVQAGVAAHVLDQRPEQARSALTEIKRVSGDALTDLRATLGVLRDPGAAAPTKPIESLHCLDELAGPLRAAGVDVTVTLDGDERRVPETIGATAYRIVQEALTNVLRHAGARRVDVRLAVESDGVTVAVVDDGASVPAVGGPTPAGSGHGLRGIAERTAAVGGSVQAGPTDGGGWQVRALLPL